MALFAFKFLVYGVAFEEAFMLVRAFLKALDRLQVAAQ